MEKGTDVFSKIDCCINKVLASTLRSIRSLSGVETTITDYSNYLFALRTSEMQIFVFSLKCIIVGIYLNKV